MHVSALPEDERTDINSVPVTTAARTLLDLAAVLNRSALERALDRAEALRLTDRVPLSELLVRYPRRKGTRVLRELLAQRRTNPTRQELEARFHDFLVEVGLPRPLINEPLWLEDRWVVPDFLWPAQRLVVELDGYETHGTKAAFIADRRKDRLLRIAGLTVIRLTWWDLEPGPERGALDRDFSMLLAPRGGRAGRVGRG